MASTIFEVIQSKIEDRVQAAQYHLGSGRVNDYSEYRETVGVIRGLNDVWTVVDELQGDMERAEDE